jgi:hypothetical protein
MRRRRWRRQHSAYYSRNTHTHANANADADADADADTDTNADAHSCAVTRHTPQQTYWNCYRRAG